MALNKQKGNMYAFVTHTWNPIRGKCPHDCSYCYMKGLNVGGLRFVEKEMETNLGEGNFIFVGSSTDMWCIDSLFGWITAVLAHCDGYNNRYLFQSKNPERFHNNFCFPANTILGTTIETNRLYAIGGAPRTMQRMETIRGLDFPKMVSIEPIMDFDLDVMVDWIKIIKPDFISIGADSKGHKLPEPPAEKVQQLIELLQRITIVKQKDNLKRLLGKRSRK